MQLQSGRLLQGGKYRIERVLGRGGFGITYQAVQVALNRKVAIKEFFMKEYCERNETTSQVSLGTSGSRETVERFRQKFIKEAQNIAALNHPHIIRIHDIFEENGTAYYVMEYCDKGSLGDLVKRQGALDEAEALRYIRQVADALGYIHERKMNHLDVKPGNILLDENMNAVLIDFGLSKRYDEEGNQTSTTPVGISHGYAPLEQYKKGGVGTFSPATDIYSLGATLYKLLTGQTPPEANDVMDDGLPALPSSVSSATASAIEKAMQPTRRNRPQSVKELLGMLADNADEATVVVEEETTVKEGISLLSWCKDGSLMIYHFGKVYFSRDIVAELNPQRVDECAENFDRYVQLIYAAEETVDSYIRNNLALIRKAQMNIMTFRSLSDFHEAHRIIKKYGDGTTFRLYSELSLSVLGFRTDIEAFRRIEHAGWYSEAEIGGGVIEILCYGRVAEETGDERSNPNLIRNVLSEHEAFRRWVIGGVMEFLILNHDIRLNIVLLDAYPGDIECCLIRNGKKMERIPLICKDTPLPARKVIDVSTKEAHELCLVVCQKEFVINIKERFGYLPAELEVVTDIDANNQCLIVLKDKSFNKEEKIELTDLY